jgi:hypothetical protein
MADINDPDVPRPPRRPRPGDPDYVAPDPNAPPPADPNAPPPGATPHPGGGWELYTPTPTPPAGPIPPPPDVPPTSESRRPPKPTAPPTAGATGDYVWQEGQPVWDPVNRRYTFPQGTWTWQGTPGPTTPTTPTTPTDNSVDSIIARGMQQGYGRTPTPQDLAYWRAAYAQWGYKDPAYFEQRVLGMGAGGADAATAGPYSLASGYRGPERMAAPIAPAMPAPTPYNTAGGATYTGDAGQDPFAGMGGGVYENGGWKPRNMYTAEQLAAYDAARAQTGTSTTTSSSTRGPVTQGDLNTARNDAILRLLQQQPATYDDLRASPEAQAYMLQSQRGAERQRGDLAERAAQEGFSDTGFFETELAGQQQQRSEGEAGFIGQLAVTRMQAQREDLQFAIDQARNSGQFEQTQALQERLAQLDAAIRREQMASTERTAASDLALREFLGKAGIDLDRLRIENQASQFGQQLGLNYDQLGYQYYGTDLDEAYRRRQEKRPADQAGG